MKTANDLKIGDIITNINHSSILTAVIVSFSSTDGAFVKGHAKYIKLRRGVKPSDLLDDICRFKFNKSTPLQNIIY